MSSRLQIAKQDLRNDEELLKTMMEAYRLHRKDRRPLEDYGFPRKYKTQRDISVASLKKAIERVKESRKKVVALTRAEKAGGR